jgi:hypothetical protein
VAEFSSRLSIEAAARGFKTALFWFHFHAKLFFCVGRNISTLKAGNGCAKGEAKGIY